MQGKILIVDNDLSWYNFLIEELEARECIINKAESIKDARSFIKNAQFEYHIILVDLIFGENPKEQQGMAFIRWLQDEKVQSKIIVVTMVQDQETAVLAFKKLGVDDFWNKKDYKIESWVDTILPYLSDTEEDWMKNIMSDGINPKSQKVGMS